MALASTADRTPQPWLRPDHGSRAPRRVFGITPEEAGEGERASQRSGDGVVEAELDGIKARKLGRLWKVRLSDGWR